MKRKASATWNGPGLTGKGILDAPSGFFNQTPYSTKSRFENEDGKYADIVNLGKAKAPTMADLGEGEWQHYLCLEAGAVSKPVSIEPGATWSAAQTFQITPQCTPIE